MKTATFYENILCGVRASLGDGATRETFNRAVSEAVSSLMDSGLDMLCVSLGSLSSDEGGINGIISSGVGVEQVYEWIDLISDPCHPDVDLMMSEAARVGANNVLIVPGIDRPGERGSRTRFKNIVTGMKRAVMLGRKYGITVCAEDLDHLEASYCTSHGLKKLLDSVPGLMCCYDTGNLMISCEDGLEALALFSDRIRAVHLKDRAPAPMAQECAVMTCSDGSLLYPSPVGSGIVPMRKILEYLSKTGYDGNVITELFSYDPVKTLDAIKESVEWTSKTIISIENGTVG